MKACFLLQRSSAYILHKLAVALKEKYGIENFCGIVYLRSSFEFLKNQKDINYTSLLLDEDIHHQFKKEQLDLNYLKNIEKEYGIPNLWPYLALDRVLMFNQLKREYPYDTPAYSHEELMKIFQIKAKAILAFLEKEKPDFIFMTVVGRVGTMLLYQIAKKKNIPVFLGVETRIDNGYILSDNYKNYSWSEQLFNNLTKNGIRSKKIDDAQKYIKKFRDKPSVTYRYFTKDDETNISQIKKFIFLLKNFLNSLYWFLKLTLQYFLKKKWRDYTVENPAEYFIDRLKRKTRTLIGFNRFYSSIDLNEDYAFFPLHLEPEISTLLQAPFWTDQLHLIRQIAKSLPLHFKLYVKEHPAMVRYRPFSYYQELKKIPNVKIIDPGLKSFELIKNSKLLITITGTAGLEAVLFKIPIITFGEVFYNALSMVKKCTELERLPYLVKEQLENFRHNEEELENFIGTILEESAPVGLHEIREIGVDPGEEKKRLTFLADLLAKKLGLRPII